MRRWSQLASFSCAALLAALLLSAATRPARNDWSAGGSLATGREGACSVALADSRVLVIGGRNAHGAVASAEVLGVDGSFTPVSPMANARSGQTCSLLADGTVLV